MKLNDNQKKYLVESITRDIILRLMQEQNQTMEDAVTIVYESNTFANLSDYQTGLYAQSPVYVYDFLLQELQQV